MGEIHILLYGVVVGESIRSLINLMVFWHVDVLGELLGIIMLERRFLFGGAGPFFHTIFKILSDCVRILVRGIVITETWLVVLSKRVGSGGLVVHLVHCVHRGSKLGVSQVCLTRKSHLFLLSWIVAHF
jgi:hypothetical protein